MSIVAATAMFPHFRTESEKSYEARKVSMIVSKIDVMISSEAFGMFKIWKCRMNLGVKAALPPPGGAAAHTIKKSSIFFLKKFGLS